MAAGLTTLVDHQQSMKYMSTTIKTLCLTCTVTSSKDRQIGAYSFGLTIPGKLSCSNKKKKPLPALSNTRSRWLGQEPTRVELLWQPTQVVQAPGLLT